MLAKQHFWELVNDSVRDAEKVYCTLPGFVVSTDEHRRLLNSIGIKTVSLSLNDVKAQRRVFYKMVCANMGLPLPSIDM